MTLHIVYALLAFCLQSIASFDATGGKKKLRCSPKTQVTYSSALAVGAAEHLFYDFVVDGGKTSFLVHFVKITHW